MDMESQEKITQESESELSEKADVFDEDMGVIEVTKETPQYFQALENTELSPEKEDGEKVSRTKKALLAITAGVMLFSATPAFGEGQHKIGAEEQQRIEIQKDFRNYEMTEEAMRTMNSWGWQLSGNVLYMREKGSYDFQTPDISRVRELKKISIFDITSDKILFRIDYQDGSTFEFYGVNGDIVHKK